MSKRRLSSVLGRLLLSLLLMFLLFYTSLPAINLRSRSFITYLVTCILIFLAVSAGSAPSTGTR